MAGEKLDEAYQQTLRDIEKYVDSYKTAIRATDEAQIRQSQEWRASVFRDVARQERWQEMVEQPANSLVRPFVVGVWANFPQAIREEKTKEIASLVEKAESDDKVAQAILLRACSILKEKKVSTAGLPSLEWRETKVTPST